METQSTVKVLYNTVPVDTQIKLYRWIENASIFCGGVSFGDYCDQLLKGETPRRVDVTIDENNITKYLLPELKRDYIGIIGQKSPTIPMSFGLLIIRQLRPLS